MQHLEVSFAVRPI